MKPAPGGWSGVAQRSGGFPALLLGLALLAGCSGVPLGPVTPPEIYPDRTEHALAFRTFLWAWHQGDVGVLSQVLGWVELRDFKRRLEAEGEEALAEWYRRGAEDLALRELEWQEEGQALARIRVVLTSSTVERAEVEYHLLKRPDGWVVSKRKVLR